MDENTVNIAKTHVAIIGGGCAGLSAAATLVEKGFQVTVYDASSQLGGRARSVLVENNSLMQLLDNGQHILLGAYSATLALLQKVGVDEKKVFLRQSLHMQMKSIQMQLGLANTAFSLKSAAYLPAPLNLLFGLITCKGLSFSERASAIKLMAHLKRTHFQLASDTPLEPFLIRHQQSPKLIAMLWEPLCLAALNTGVAIASTRIFLNVLKDSFSSGASTHGKKSDFLLPRLDLSKILAHPLSQYIQEKGGVIKLNKRVRSVAPEGNGFNLTTREGSTFYSHVIIAVPPRRLDVLIEAMPKLQYVLNQIKSYGYQPIYTVYLQYSPEITLPSVMTGLTGAMGQWVFDRGQLCEQKGLMSVVISASGGHQLLTHDELALQVAKEIHQAFPHLPQPLWHKVIAEKHATFSCTPNLARPSNKTMQPNLFLAGDYTYADYPATIEGAVRSGIACADLICNS